MEALRRRPGRGAHLTGNRNEDSRVALLVQVPLASLLVTFFFFLFTCPFNLVITFYNTVCRFRGPRSPLPILSTFVHLVSILVLEFIRPPISTARQLQMGRAEARRVEQLQWGLGSDREYAGRCWLSADSKQVWRFEKKMRINVTR